VSCGLVRRGGARVEGIIKEDTGAKGT